MNLQRLGGDWKVIGSDILYSGELLWGRENGIIQLLLYRLADESNPLADIPIWGDIPAIGGVLVNGTKVVLYDCKSGPRENHVLTRTTLTIYAKYIFWGLKVESIDQLIFTEFEVDFGNITDWSGMCHYENNFENNSISWVHKPEIELVLDTCTIKIWCSSPPSLGTLTNQQIILEQSIHFNIMPRKKISFELFWEEIVRLRNLISLGIQQNVSIYKLVYYHECNKFSHHPEHIRPEEVSLNTKTVEVKESTIGEYLFTLQELCDDNIKINNWFEKYTKLKPVVDLFASIYLYKDIPREMFFLNMTQALETYHSRFIGNSVSNYCELIDNMINHLYKDVQDGENAKWARNYLMPPKNAKGEYSDSITLKTRLRYLMFVNYNWFFYTLDYKCDAFIDKVVISRNYYTHYNMNKEKHAFTKTDLPMVNAILLNVVKYYILKELGFDEDICMNKIRDEQQGLVVQDSIRKSLK